MLRRAVKVAALTGAGALGAGVTSLYLDAPRPDMADGMFDADRRHDVCPEWLHDIGRLPLILLCTFNSKVTLNLLNTTTVEGLEKLLRAQEERPRKQALITVSNHSSMLDDPAVIATMLPWKYTRPSKTRWGFVTQEYSYTLGRVSSAFFFAAKVLPVKRGNGVDQPMVKALFEKVQEGTWVHVFPEGKVEQRAVLGGRKGPTADELGCLKWGTAKLIARADVRPIVIPFYHSNMEQVLPQGDDDELLSVIPRTGVNVTIRVGDPIDLEDLFEKYSECRVIGSKAPWESQEKEKPLYAAITTRLEAALRELAPPEATAREATKKANL